MAAVLRRAVTGDTMLVALAAIFPDLTGKTVHLSRQEGLRVWLRLTFAGTAVSGVAGGPLKEHCAMPRPNE